MMLGTATMRFPSKRAYLVAVICLALMVVALGAAAKHSQFASPLDSTHYLKQSVKMVSASYFPAVEVPEDAAEFVFVNVAPVPIWVELAPVFVSSAVPAPLLI